MTALYAYSEEIKRVLVLADRGKADVDDLVKKFDYKPSMDVKQGVKNFVDWFKEYHSL